MGTKAEEAHKDGVAGMGCLRCLELGYEDTPAEIHHAGTGAGGRRDDMKVVGLCPHHHRWLKDSVDKLGKARAETEARWLEYVAEHCPCFTCKEIRDKPRPIRIQRKRTAGWKMPENTVYVGRPSVYGNEFDHAKLGRATAVENYRVWLSAHMKAGSYMAKHVAELKGKHLACWCPANEPCHADVLLEFANE